jgi:ankyrin repeat protein
MKSYVISKDMHGIILYILQFRKGLFEDILILLENGEDVNSQDSDGKTPLHISCKDGHERLLSLLQWC